MPRDIDYAAVAVKTSINDKFGRKEDLNDLQVTANERTISIVHEKRAAEGTRDDLLAAVRAAESYADLWDRLPTFGQPRRS